MKISQYPCSMAMALLMAFHWFSALPSTAQIDGAWITNDDGNWSDASNWSSDPLVPGGAGSTIDIDAAITANRTVTLDNTDRTVGILNIGSTDWRRYTLESSGGASLIFDNGGSNAQINFLASGDSNTITAPLVLNSNLLVNNASDSSQLIDASTVSAGSAGAKTISHTGNGTATVEYRFTNVDNSVGDIGLSITSPSSRAFLSAPGGNVTLEFADGIVVDGGHLALRFNILPGDNSFYLNNAILSRPGTTGTRTASGTFSMGGTVDYNTGSGTEGDLVLNGDIQLHANTVLAVNGGELTIRAPISGAFSLTKTGDNTLVLREDAKTFSGGFIQDGGVTRVLWNADLIGTGAVTLRDGNLRLSNFVSGLTFSNEVIVQGDATLTSERHNSGGDGFSHNMQTLEIDGHTLTIYPLVSDTTEGQQGFNFGETTVTGGATLNVLNSSHGIVVGKVRLGALNGAGDLTKDGPGILELSAAAGTYAGVTSVEGGTVIIEHAGALGPNSLIISGGTVVAPSGAALSNSAIMLAGGEYVKAFADGESFANYSSATSDFAAGITTSATFLDGSAGDGREVMTSFSDAPVGVGNDSFRASDVFIVSGTSTDIFALQLAVDSLTDANYLGWVNNDGAWVNAVEGNSFLGASAEQGFLGSYAVAQVSATAEYLGSWGVDSSTGSVWAILDHNSQFAVIPEPSSAILVLAALLGAWGWGRRRHGGH